MAVEQARGWRSILTAVPLTAPDSNIATHPRATLDAQAARLLAARQEVMKLDMEIQSTDNKYAATRADIDKYYREQIAGVEAQYVELISKLQDEYASAHDALTREQKQMTEMLKQVDCKAEFISNFPPPKDAKTPEPRQQTRPQS